MTTPTPETDELLSKSHVRSDLHRMCRKLERERDAWKAKAERTCVARKRLCNESHTTYWEYSCGLESYYDVGATFCDQCGGRIVKEEE